jgi:hypothetical protein
MLREIVKDQLWVAEDSFGALGAEFGARMTVVRLPAGGLFVHSPLAPDEALRRELDALGSVQAIVSPSRMHYLGVAAFSETYPDARVYAVPASQRKLKLRQPAELLGDTAPPEWAAVMEQSVICGSRLYDEVDFFHAPSRTLILTDLLFNIPVEGSNWMTRFQARVFGILGRLSTSKSFRLSMKEPAVVRASLEQIFAWDFDRVIVSHGAIVERDGKAAFRHAFSWLGIDIDGGAPAG